MSGNCSYEKLEVLGSGSFGKVYLARNKRTKKQVVVKEVETKGFSATEREQALNEVAILGRCRHVNIIRYREAFVDGSILNIVMDHADGGDLHEKIEQAKWTYIANETVVDWFVQICFALRHIHGLNILHRDLKAKNIFVTSKNTIKVGDFGIARMLSSADAHAQTTIGTPYYISPEICQRLPYNHKSDMWSLGCVLYELCSLEHPFEASDLGTLVARILDGRYKPIPRHCGPLLEDLVSVLLRADANTRPSADQILCVPALRPYVQTYVRRMTGEKGLPGTPRPQTRRCSVDVTPNPIPFVEMHISSDEEASSGNSEGEMEHSTPESPSHPQKKYIPRTPSPLTIHEDDPVSKSRAPVMQLCVRNQNMPIVKELPKKKNVAIADTDKENFISHKVALSGKAAKQATVGRAIRARSLTPQPNLHNIVDRQKRVTRSAEVVRQAKMTLRGNKRFSPRLSLYKEVLLKKTPVGSALCEMRKMVNNPVPLAKPPPGVNLGTNVVPYARPSSPPSGCHKQRCAKSPTSAAKTTESVDLTDQDLTDQELTDWLLSSICLDQNEAFEKLETLRDFLEKSLSSNTLVNMCDELRSKVQNNTVVTSLGDPIRRRFLPLVLQMIQLETMAGN